MIEGWKDYRFSVEPGHENYEELKPLYFSHYAEMKARLEQEGIEVAECNPRLDQYFQASRSGYLLNFVARTLTGEAVGYANVYLTGDMHNGELIAQEDTIFIHKNHRRGVGKHLLEYILEQLKIRGVKHLRVQAMTDPRIVSLWQRMGFKPVATCMIYRFQGN